MRENILLEKCIIDYKNWQTTNSQHYLILCGKRNMLGTLWKKFQFALKSFTELVPCCEFCLVQKVLVCFAFKDIVFFLFCYSCWAFQFKNFSSFLHAFPVTFVFLSGVNSAFLCYGDTFIELTWIWPKHQTNLNIIAINYFNEETLGRNNEIVWGTMN